MSERLLNNILQQQSSIIQKPNVDILLNVTWIFSRILLYSVSLIKQWVAYYLSDFRCFIVCFTNTMSNNNIIVKLLYKTAKLI